MSKWVWWDCDAYILIAANSPSLHSLLSDDKVDRYAESNQRFARFTLCRTDHAPSAWNTYMLLTLLVLVSGQRQED